MHQTENAKKKRRRGKKRTYRMREERGREEEEEGGRGGRGDAKSNGSGGTSGQLQSWERRGRWSKQGAAATVIMKTLPMSGAPAQHTRYAHVQCVWAKARGYVENACETF